MITFFRRIRLRLLGQATSDKVRNGLLEGGRTSRYLLYAIGEIALVVIGILIALQINNWNDWRKDRVQEKILLRDLTENLDINILSLRDDIEFLQQKDRSSKIVLEALNNRMPFVDSLKIHFHEARVTKQNLSLSSISYQALKDHGIDIISNKELAKEIMKLFEVIIPNILSTSDLVNKSYGFFDNHVVQNFTFVQGEGLTPRDYESLFSDHFYISWIDAYREGRYYLVEVDHELIKEIERVLQLIKEELRSADN